MLVCLSFTIVSTAIDLYVQIEKRDTKFAYQIILFFLYGLVIFCALFIGCIRFISSYMIMSKIPSIDLQITGKYAEETQMQSRHFLQLTKIPHKEMIDRHYIIQLYNTVDWSALDPIQKKSFKQQTMCIYKKNPSQVELEKALQVLEYLRPRN